MDDGKFQWNDAKAAKNFATRGLTFDLARKVFEDPLALDWLDESEHYAEYRYAIVGMADGRLLYVAYTMRGAAVRIITARKAEPHERRKYNRDIA